MSSSLAGDEQRRDAFLIVSATLTGISTSIVLLRCVLRFYFIRKPWWDDYYIIAALVATIGNLANIIYGLDNGLGFPSSTLSLDNMTNMLKGTFILELTYYSIVYFFKTSILFMYLRIGATPNFKRACYGMIGLLTAFYIVCMGGVIFQCTPIHKLWDLLGTVEGTCIDTNLFFYFTAAFIIVTDIIVLVLPISTLLGLLVSTPEKIALVIVFSIGILSTAMSCVRLATIYTYTLSTDKFHDATWFMLWSMVEVTSGIICASIPAVKPILTPSRLMETLRSHSDKSGSAFQLNERSGASKSGASMSRGHSNTLSANDSTKELHDRDHETSSEADRHV